MADWQPDQLIESEIGNTRAFLWIVPANVNGTWTFTEVAGRSTFKLALEQSFQVLKSAPPKSTLKDAYWAVPQGRVNGSTVELTVVPGDGVVLPLQGRIDKDRIDARVTREGRVVRYVGARDL